METIVHIQLADVEKRLADRDIAIAFDPPVIRLLAEEGYDPVFGARPLKRLIQHKIVNRLSTAILKGEIQPGQQIVLKLEGDQIALV